MGSSSVVSACCVWVVLQTFSLHCRISARSSKAYMETYPHRIVGSFTMAMCLPRGGWRFPEAFPWLASTCETISHIIAIKTKIREHGTSSGRGKSSGLSAAVQASGDWRNCAV